jgi:hypothetical protein
MDREAIEERIAELNIYLSAAESLEQAEYINKLIRDLEKATTYLTHKRSK